MSTKNANKKKDQPVSSEQGHWDQIELNAKTGKLSLDELISHADSLQKKGDTQRIDVLYSSWIKSSNSPHKFVACFNYGVLLGASGKNEEAIFYYRQAIAANPVFCHPRINIGLAYERLSDPEKAIAEWRAVVDESPMKEAAPIDMKTAALNHIGRLKEQQREFEEAETALAESLMLNPKQRDAIHHWFHLRQKQCKWPALTELPGVSKNMILQSMSPLAALAFEDDPAYQMFVGDQIVRQKFTFDNPPLFSGEGYKHTKIKIGYLSGDLCMHAVGLILPELFELHDKNRFELYAYDYSREDGTLLRQRYKQSTPNFFSIKELDDAQAASLIRAHEIDILVDLHGLSLGIRAGILGARPAPIQMTYLGYIGTTMMPYVDYVITDKFCFTDELTKFFSETPLKMDRCCIPSDRKRQIDVTPSRSSVGLPEDKKIFATFNNAYKLNPEMYACWMKILNRVPDSVLWIIDDNPWATANLKAYASEQGVSPERLIFTQRVQPASYLGRMPLADIFLDNYPYNAGSTGSDVLWMGVPMITLSGKTFVSRMAGSMLHHSGLSWLIANNYSQYEELAVALIDRPDLLKSINTTLIAQREKGGAFDMDEFTRDLEKKYEQVYLSIQ